MSLDRFLAVCDKFLDDATVKNLGKERATKIAKRLIKRAESYGIHLEIRSLLMDHLKQAFQEDTPSESQKSYPLRNSKEVKTAADWFFRYRHKLAYARRRELATEILRKAGEFCLKLDGQIEDILCKSAGLGISSLDTIVENLNQRLIYLNRNGFHEEEKKLAAWLDKIAKTDEETFYKCGDARKLAEDIDKIDRDTRLIYKCAWEGEPSFMRPFLLPEDWIYSLTKKEVDPLKNLVRNVKTGKYYLPEDLTKLDGGLFQELIGEPSWTKVAVGNFVDPLALNEWLKEASMDKARLFDGVMEACGVLPFGQKLVS